MIIDNDNLPIREDFLLCDPNDPQPELEITDSQTVAQHVLSNINNSSEFIRFKTSYNIDADHKEIFDLFKERYSISSTNCAIKEIFQLFIELPEEVKGLYQSFDLSVEKKPSTMLTVRFSLQDRELVSKIHSLQKHFKFQVYIFRAALNYLGDYL